MFYFISLKADYYTKKLEMLKGVKNFDSSDITKYKIDIQEIQKKLCDLDPKQDHPEIQPPAEVNRLLENLNDDQEK